MFGLGKKENNDKPDNPLTASALKISKGEKLTISKTPLIRVVTSWTDPDKDYDVMALVKYTDGHVETVCAVNNEKLQTVDGAVKHTGDIGAGSGQKTETIEVRLNPNVQEIVPFAYSARENGEGSFREYGVSVSIDNGTDQAVAIEATESSPDRNRYTLVFGRISNGNRVEIEALELYSSNHSEKRPAYVNGVLKIDAGPENMFK